MQPPAKPCHARLVAAPVGRPAAASCTPAMACFSSAVGTAPGAALGTARASPSPVPGVPRDACIPPAAARGRRQGGGEMCGGRRPAAASGERRPGARRPRREPWQSPHAAACTPALPPRVWGVLGVAGVALVSERCDAESERCWQAAQALRRWNSTLAALRAKGAKVGRAAHRRHPASTCARRRSGQTALHRRQNRNPPPCLQFGKAQAGDTLVALSRLRVQLPSRATSMARERGPRRRSGTGLGRPRFGACSRSQSHLSRPSGAHRNPAGAPPAARGRAAACFAAARRP